MECFYFLAIELIASSSFVSALRLVVFIFNRNNFFFRFMLISGEAEKVKTLIRLRAELSPLFTGKRNASKYAWA